MGKQPIKGGMKKMNGTFKKRLAQGDILLGIILTLPSLETAEILSLAGFDWFFVDLEHSAMGVREAQAILQVVGHRVPCVVRVPSLDEAWIKKVLDTGPAGIIVPMIRTAEEAERAVRFTKYPPMGTRGAGAARAQAYGADFNDYVARANDEIAVILQMEHKDSVENIQAIQRVPGIDVLFVGPYDLSGSLGILGQVQHPEVLAAIARVRQSAEEAGIPLGIYGGSLEDVKSFIADGFRLIALGTDAVLLGTSARRLLEQSGKR